METGSWLKKFFAKLRCFVRNTEYNAFEIVIPGFSESEGDIGNDI